MNNKKVLLGLTVLATPFVVENLVETNVASANQSVATAKKQSATATTSVAKSREYVLATPAKAYVTANDAAKRVNSKTTYQAGSYHVYNQNQGMVNISRATGKPGSWINPVDNPNAKTTTNKPASTATNVATSTTKTTSQPTQNASTTVKGTNLSLTTPKAGQYSLLKSTAAYVNAVDASNKVNAKGTVSAGNYYVYREHKGMLNVSRVQGKVGSWINPSATVIADLNKTTTEQTTKPTTPTQTAGITTSTSTTGTKTNTGLFSLTSSTEAYVNAADASKKVNARGKVAPGSYHIFREYKGMLNISKAQGKAGSWINPGVVATTTTTPTAPASMANTTGQTTQTVGSKTNAGLFTLASATESYVNAADASRKVNARGKVSAGNYHIFREYKGMLNISRAQGKPGSWINPGVTVATPVSETKSTTTTKQTETKPTSNSQDKSFGTKTSTGTYSLTSPTHAYVNSADASKKVNAKGIVSAGSYYIFREHNGMLNISKAQGKVGSWINPGVTSTQNGKTPAPVATKATPQNVTSPTYVNGVLLVNKKHPLPQSYNPGENREAKLNFDNLRNDLRKAGHGVSTSYSGFRSYNHQANLYKNYVARNGQAVADTFSARPGYSEHQTGLAFDLIDLNGAALGGQGTTSASKKAADWVAQNAHKYGFIVRYKENIKNITGYMSEPWHLRYVGKTVASEIFRKNIALETYLGAPGGDYIK